MMTRLSRRVCSREAPRGRGSPRTVPSQVPGAGIALPTRWVRAELNYSYTDWGWLTQMQRGTLRLVF